MGGRGANGKGKSGGKASGGGSFGEKIKAEFSQTTVSVKDKWGDVISSDRGYTNENGDLYALEGNDKSGYRILAGDTNRGFVASIRNGNKNFTKAQAEKKMYEYLKRKK